MTTLTKIEVQVGIIGTDLSFTSVDAKRTANRVTTKQEALWSSQHLGTLNIKEAGNGRTVTALVKVVLKECRRWIAANTEVLCSYTADTDRIDVRVLRVTAHARRVGNQILDVVEVCIFDEVARKRSNS